MSTETRSESKRLAEQHAARRFQPAVADILKRAVDDADRERVLANLMHNRPEWFCGQS
jgi:hypothetical protein